MWHSQMTVAVATYGGVSNETAMEDHADDLRDALDANGWELPSEEAGMYFFSGYDSPFRPNHRHNEIWQVVANKILVLGEQEEQEEQAFIVTH